MALRAVLAAASLALAVPALPVAAAPPPPAEAFARLPAMQQPSFSPDSRRIAYLTPVDGVNHVAVADVLSDARPTLIGSKDTDIRWVRWANRDRLLIGVTAARPNPSHRSRPPLVYSRIFAVNADGSDMKLLLDPKVEDGRSITFGGQFIARLNEREVLVSVPSPDRPALDVARLDIHSGDYTRVVSGIEDATDFLVDAQKTVRLVSRYDDDSGTYEVLYRRSEDERFESILKGDVSRDRYLALIAVLSDDRLLVASNHEGDRIALYEYAIGARQFVRKVADDPEFDVVSASVGLGDDEGELETKVIRYTRDLPVVRFLDPDFQGLQDRVDKAVPGSTEFIRSVSADRRFFLLASVAAGTPHSYMLFDREKGQLSTLASAYPELDPATLPTRRPVRYKARDGADIPGYLTLPAGSEARNLPFVLLPHGGPTARDDLGFDSLAQFIASRGYAVLQPNFRGSSGYGTAHRQAGYQQWGRLMQTDVMDGLDWAVREGIADPRRVCIVGWSYGGYSALIGAVQSSDKLRCAASVAGIGDLQRLYREQRWFGGTNAMRDIIGPDEASLAPYSPIRHVDRIQVPVLLVQGDLDRRVPPVHATEFADALKDAGKPHELVMVKGMDHSGRTTQQRTEVFRALETFLAKHLGG